MKQASEGQDGLDICSQDSLPAKSQRHGPRAAARPGEGRKMKTRAKCNLRPSLTSTCSLVSPVVSLLFIQLIFLSRCQPASPHRPPRLCSPQEHLLLPRHPPTPIPALLGPAHAVPDTLLCQGSQSTTLPHSDQTHFLSQAFPQWLQLDFFYTHYSNLYLVIMINEFK